MSIHRKAIALGSYFSTVWLRNAGSLDCYRSSRVGYSKTSSTIACPVVEGGALFPNAVLPGGSCCYFELAWVTVQGLSVHISMEGRSSRLVNQFSRHIRLFQATYLYRTRPAKGGAGRLCDPAASYSRYRSPVRREEGRLIQSAGRAKSVLLILTYFY